MSLGVNVKWTLNSSENITLSPWTPPFKRCVSSYCLSFLVGGLLLETKSGVKQITLSLNDRSKPKDDIPKRIKCQACCLVSKNKLCLFNVREKLFVENCCD